MDEEYLRARDYRRFEAKFRKPPHEKGCWLWTAGVSGDGYGMFSFRSKMVKAHRASWMLYRGEIPIGEDGRPLCVLHKCDTPLCVNPDHLFLGTEKDNSDDMISKGRGPWVRQKIRRSTDVLLTHNGKTQCVADWARHLAVRPITLYKRLERGWPVEMVLTPELVRPRELRVGQETLLVSEWAKRAGISVQAIYARLKRGWAPERAVLPSSR